MGREANCTCEWNGASAQVKALLEPPELILRGSIRRKIPFALMERVTANGERLHFTLGADNICLILGAKMAATWAKALLTAPPTLAKKLGLAPASTVRIIGTIDDDALYQALIEARQVATGSAELVLARINTPAELKAAFRKASDLVARGVPLWIVYRKGPGHAINESDVRSSGLAAGIVDVKVASVSAQLTALKFVKRKNPKQPKNVLQSLVPSPYVPSPHPPLLYHRRGPPVRIPS